MDGKAPPIEASQPTPYLLETIERKARMSLNRKPPTNPTIFRVPPGMRCGNCGAYKPKVVSIGPYHRRHKSKDLKAMEELKWRLLHHYLSKVPNGRNNETLRNMKHLEKHARDCYSEVINLDSDQFVEMLLLDGCFLVQLFIVIDSVILQDKKLRSQQLDNVAEELRLLLRDNMWFRNLIFVDLLLLENQLPYFIIVHLLGALRMWDCWEEVGTHTHSKIRIKRDSFRLQKAAIYLFTNFLPQPLLPSPCFLGVDHLLHLFHKWILSIPKSDKVSNTRSCNALSLMISKTGDCLSKVLPCCIDSSPSDEHQLSVPIMIEHADQELPASDTTETEDAEETPPISVPAVTELVEAGVKIKVKEAKSFRDISFCENKGVLEIPAITVDDNTNFLFANLIALEQSCHTKHGLEVTHYTMFLDDIINTPTDVELLHQEGIIHRDLGNNEVIASLFNKLGNGVSYGRGKNYLKHVHIGLNTYCQSRWPRWRAKAVRDYFSSPWAIISLGAAVVLLGLTILQSVYAVLDYYKK